MTTNPSYDDDHAAPRHGVPTGEPLEPTQSADAVPTQSADAVPTQSADAVPTQSADAVPTESIDDAPRGRLLSHRYELGEVIGRGGMAEVRRAYDTRLGRQVAVKELRFDLASDPTFQARFRREAQSAAGLNHPNIVAVYDTGEEADGRTGLDVPYIVMELVEGQTLRDVLRAGRKILPERALELGQGVLDALSYSHRAGIIHRDIKPANVMLTPQGSVKVMDFGIARAVADTSTSMTQTAAVIGTAQYLSPEQARGEQVDNRSDIYSAGCLLYELLVGRPPFVGDSPVSVAYQHVRELPVPPSQLDELITPEIDAIVLKSLAKDPADRYQTARDMRDDIARLFAGQEITASLPAVATTSLGEPTGAQSVVPAPAPALVEEDDEDPEEPKKKIWPWLLGLVAVLLVLGGLAYWFVLRPTQPTGPAQVAVPRVVGNTRQSAENRIVDAQFKPVLAEEAGADDQTVGTVTKQAPEGGAMAPAGSEVTLTVNVGPKKLQIPTGLVGKDKDEVRTALAQAGFTAVELVPAQGEPTDAKADHVTAINPGEGQTVAASTQITVSYATGKAAVPNWVGLNRTAVERDARQRGFTDVRFEDADTTDASQSGVVVNTRPGEGTDVDRSSRIVVYIGRLSRPTQVPTPTPTPSSTPSRAPTPTPARPSEQTSAPAPAPQTAVPTPA